ncbi:hypothetical protein [Chondrinema litorale]|uniref:hypothetical protein n=1 Tax=Chondrinema litorale TaxID=2994555 RepID=UPI002543C1B3|nr:hypothetical protein [Chondrinema litorale]UZR99050.1 hypothetical protein OQ292_34825 [Chondrinema litorale]
MTSKVTYYTFEDTLTIKIEPTARPIISFGFIVDVLFRLALFAFTVYSFIYRLKWHKLEVSSIIILVLIASFVVLIIFFFVKRLMNFFEAEILIVNQEKIEIITKALIWQKGKSYRVKDISHLSYLGEEELINYSSEALKHQTGLYQTANERELDTEEGSISFFYNGYTVRFAKNVYLEEGENMVEVIKKFCGNLEVKSDFDEV